MSWIEKLYRTYETNTDRIGDRNDGTPLLPICHTIQNAHVRVVIDGTGEFLRASVVPKDEARTIIPATEQSAGRTSGPVAHPLCDKLQYVAGDYARYRHRKSPGFELFCAVLSEWCLADSGNAKLQAILSYARKKRLISDLIRERVLHIDEQGALLASWPTRSDVPQIFKVLPSGADQADAFVRWSVEMSDVEQADVWTDQEFQRSWIAYYGSKEAERGFCYVTGNAQAPLAKQHPKNIRRPGDGAKLISSNDLSGYTFRGRFTLAGEACGVSFEVTQKAHNALRWLIARQGRRDGDQAIVAWAVSGGEVPDVCADTFSLVLGRAAEEPRPDGGYTAQEIGVQLSKRIAGYAAELGDTTDVVVMALDSATPGRMAITFYRELTGSELLARVQAWHEGCSWLQRFGRDRVFIGAPAPRDIAETAYGRRLDEKLRKATVERLLHCIIDGSPIPPDLVELCIRRASNRQGIEPWEWEKALGIACALYRYRNKERSYTVALDRHRKTRDYLYGRLLALAEHLEARALYVGGERRETNAAKLMQRFAERPYATWLTIETGLSPYKTRLRTRRSAFLYNVEKEMDEVVDAFTADDFISNHRLSGEFLLGYHCQRAALRAEVGQADGTDDDTEA